MTRSTRIIRNAVVTLAALLIISAVAVFITVRSDWFRNFVTQKIVTETQQAIGGRVEVGSIAFDWRKLEATALNFVIHGNESEGSAPFLSVPRVVVDFRLFTSFHRILNVAFLELDQPAANVWVREDGSTNVPTAPRKQTSSSSPLQTLVDLAIGRFDLKDGVIHYNSSSQPIDVQGKNLRVRLSYHVVKQGYDGNLSFQPVYVAAGRKTPVTVSLNLPVTIERDRIAVQDATIVTPLSELMISGSMQHLSQPTASAKIAGRLSLIDLNNLANLSLAPGRDKKLSEIELNGDADLGPDSIRIGMLRLALGRSNVDVQGALPFRNSGSLDFTSNLNLAELSQVAKLDTRASGNIALNGKANINGQTVRLDPFQIRGFGGEVDGSGTIEQFARYQISARLSGFDIQALQRTLGRTPLPYSAHLGGTLDAKGDLSSSPAAMDASASVNILPVKGAGGGAIPVSGKINASYNTASDDLRAVDSSLILPNTTIKFNGSLRQGLNLTLLTRDLHDLLAADPSLAASAPVKLNGGEANLRLAVTGSLSNPTLQGHVEATRIAIQDRLFDALAADFNANQSHASVAAGEIRRKMMRAQFAGSVGLMKWSPQQNAPLSATASLNDGDLADLLALAGQKSAGYSGDLTAAVNVGGTLANPTGTANVRVMNGVAQEEMFDDAQAQISFTDQRVTLPSAYIRHGSEQLNLSADYQHSRDSLTDGHLSAHLNGTPIDLAQIHAIESKYRNTQGTVQVDATLAGDLKSANAAPGTVPGKTATGSAAPAFQITNVAADVSARGVRFEGQNYGDLTAKATTTGGTVAYNLTSDFAGSQIRADGRTQLAADYPTTLDATIGNLSVDRLLTVAKRQDIPARGVLAGNVHFSGTVKNPQGQANLTLSNAVLYEEPLDRVELRAAYLPDAIEVTQLQAAAGPSRLSLTARFNHPAGDLNQGTLQFQVEQSRIDLARLHTIQQRRPGLAGSVQISASGKAELRAPAADTSRIALQELTADLGASGLQAYGKSLGTLNLAANTSGGNLNFTLNSTLASSSIQGRGQAQLSGDFPANAQLTFGSVSWANLQPLIGGTAPEGVDGSTSGSISLNGPLAKPDRLNATLRLSSLQLRRTPPGGAAPQVLLQNQGDIALSLQGGQVRIESAHLTGSQTDINASGTASIRDKTADMKLDATANLAILQSTLTDTIASGTVTLTATAQGALTDPQVNGKLELHSASVSYAGMPLGFANANGTVALNRNTATFQNVTADSGGGKITLTGFVARENNLRFGLKANARSVRVHAQQGVDIVTTGNLDLSGTTENSLASGSLNIDRVTYAPQTDIGSLLTRSTPNVDTTENSPLLTAMRLDILVRTSSATAVQASAAENVQILTDLRIRGTAAQPGATGSVQLTRGKLALFGSTYTLDTGTISFYNPNRIRPLLNLALETKAKGVTVNLSVTGPVDNLKLSYTSDPPLQFEEIVALLAAGTTPTSDPTLLANQPSQPPQDFQQRGESAIVSKAVTDPLSNRLQRVFGVSQLKIDPSFTSGSELPQARVSLQQQVATNIVFTYVTDLNDANATEVRVEWSLNPQWSAIADRDENGLFSVNLQYKKEFR
jgi:translocation and assembly module TamB